MDSAIGATFNMAWIISEGLGGQPGNVCDPVDKIIPVDATIPGCPPRPSEIIQAILKVAPIALSKREKHLKKVTSEN